MKNIKKITSLLCLLLIGVMFAFTGLTSVNAASQSTTISHSGASEKYISGIDFYFLKVSDGTVVYCYDGSEVKWPDAGTNYTLSSEASAGVKYILENGYPNKNITGNDKVDQYITQAAIWWYRAEMENGPKLNTEFTETAADPYNLRDKIKTLVNEAKSAKGSKSEDLSINVSVDTTNMALSSDKKYYVSSEIAPEVKGASTYKVEVSGVDGIITTDTKDQNKSSFSAGEKFLIKIPVNSLKQTTTINVKVSATGSSKAYIYKPSGNQQQIVGLFSQSAEKTVKLNATVKNKNKDQVCVDYVIVGNVIPDPAKTDPTPGRNCYDKGTKYNQEKELTTRQANCKFNGWFTKSDLTGKWTNGTALNNDMTLYGAWDCGTSIKVPATAANTPFIILGVGLVAIISGVCVYLYRNKKIKSNK